VNVGIAYRSFMSSFKQFYPNLQLIDFDKDKDLSKYNLIIFSGGEDINPNIYGRKNTHSYGINPKRDKVEQAILSRALELKIKILGVCRGHQLINAFLGGALVQDIYSELNQFHSSPHNLDITIENSLANFILQGMQVNSLHHQGVINRGSGLTTTSHYKHVIESTESKNIFTVQWHPEFMMHRKFFDVVNRWVTDSDSLASEVKKFSRGKSEDSIKKEKKRILETLRVRPEDFSYTFISASQPTWRPEELISRETEELIDTGDSDD